MRKGILFSLVCLIAIVTVACGSGNNAAGNKVAAANGANGAGCTGGDGCGGDGGEAAEDGMAFYKKVGNFYLSKTTGKNKYTGDWADSPATFMRMEVTKVDGNKITYKMTTYDDKMKETYSADQTMDLTPPAVVADVKVDPPKTTKEKITVKAGDFDATKMETDMAGTKTTSWSFKGIGVKSVSKSDMMESTTELQEYKVE